MFLFKGLLQHHFRQLDDRSGPLAFTWSLREQNDGGSGVGGSLHHNGVLVDSASTDDTNGFTRTYYLNIESGDVVDLALTPVGPGGDSCCSSFIIIPEGDNDPKHYADLGDSMLSLFRVVTLEDWTDIMYINMYGSDNYGYELSEMSRYPGIVPTASPLASVIFHVSFVLFGTMVMLNLFIGVIMTGMQEAQEETLQLNEKDGTTNSKLGDYSAIVEEMRELEDQVETLRNRLRGVREREEKRK